jgi:hypothetical protein
LYGVVVDHLERFIGIYDERYAARYGDWRPEVERVLRRFLQCGILEHGFMRVACRECRAEYLVAYSCKGRGLCPSCGQRRGQEFAAFLQEAVLEDIPYRHVVFTIPKALRPTFLRERRLLRLLSRCAWNTIRQAMETALDHGGVVPGAVVSVATAGDLGNSHPHLHCIVSDGAWDKRSGTFHAWPHWLTSDLLTELFRRQVLAMLVREERLSPETRERLLAWNPSGFSVFVGDPISAENTASRERLARYLVKPAVALERLSYNAETCRLTVTSEKRGEQRTLQALDFMAELSVHVPDPGEHTTRYYGWLSNRSRGDRTKARAAVEPSGAKGPGPPPTQGNDAAMPAHTRKRFRLAWAALLKRVWDVDALRCLRCDGPMRIISAITQADVIARILRSVGLLHQARAPDPHDCDDRNPDAVARHPLFHPQQEDAGDVRDVEPDGPADVDSDDAWSMDPPHPDD